MSERKQLITGVVRKVRSTAAEGEYGTYYRVGLNIDDEWYNTIQSKVTVKDGDTVEIIYKLTTGKDGKQYRQIEKNGLTILETGNTQTPPATSSSNGFKKNAVTEQGAEVAAAPKEEKFGGQTIGMAIKAGLDYMIANQLPLSQAELEKHTKTILAVCAKLEVVSKASVLAEEDKGRKVKVPPKRGKAHVEEILHDDEPPFDADDEDTLEVDI